MSLTFDLYQHRTANTAIYRQSVDALVDELFQLEPEQAKERLRRLLYLSYAVLGLTNEAGELAGVLKKMFRDNGARLTPDVREKFGKELGDTEYYAARCAVETCHDLGEVCAGNLDKLADRKARGVLRGSGDDR